MMKALVYHGPGKKAREEKPKPGDTIAIVGAGPVGMAALLTAQIFSPSEIITIDLDDNRLKIAKTFGATHISINKLTTH